MEALTRSLSTGGMRNSGNRMTAITDYAQGLASTEYEADYARKFGEYQNRFNMGMARTQFGAGIADRIAGLQTGYGVQQSDIYGNYGSAVAGTEGEYNANSANMEMGLGASYAGQRRTIGNTWAASNMYAADQNAQAFDRYIMPMMGGGAGGMMGGGGGSGGGMGNFSSMMGGTMGGMGGGVGG